MAARLLITRGLPRLWSPSCTLTTLIQGADLIRSKQYFDSSNQNALQQASESMFIVPDFISPAEESCLLEETEKILKRIRYEDNHWDDAIHHYRETEHLRWTPPNQAIIDRVRAIAFKSNNNLIKYVHILDIAKDGFIKPHVDSVRFCGDTISGISLLSDSVMRLALEVDKSIYVDVLLNRRSLYIMTGKSRYEYTHEVLSQEHSRFRGTCIPRDRRISIICRNEPEEE